MTDATTLPLLAAMMVGLTVLLFSAGVMALRAETGVRSRLNRYLAGNETKPVTALEIELAEPFFKRAVAPMLRRLLRLLAWMWPKNRIDHLRYRIILAGQPAGLTPSDFIGLKGWCMLVVGGIAVLLGYLSDYPVTLQTLILFGLLLFVSFFLPDIWLSRQITRRQQEIIKVMPDMLDMLVVAMESGLSFENALVEITSRWDNALSLELLRLQRDLGMGQSRKQALMDLSYRTGVGDIAAFASAINQAEELGVSITRVLVVQADELRVRRRQRAQERANKAPIKMLFPMVFLIFPSLFAVLLGPGVPRILRALGNL